MSTYTIILFFVFILHLGYSKTSKTRDRITKKKSPDEIDPSMHASFWNYDTITVDLWWDDRAGGIHNGRIEPERKVDIDTYVGHKFWFSPVDKQEEKLHSVIMTHYEPHYYLYSPARRAQVDQTKAAERDAFLKSYFEESGIPWIHFYPRDKPAHFMYTADFKGQTWPVFSNVSYLEPCQEESDSGGDSSSDTEAIPEEVCTAEGECSSSSSPEPTALQPTGLPTLIKHGTEEHCGRPDPVNLKIELLCDKPKVYVVRNLLSDYECDEIVKKGFEMGFTRSTIADTADVDPTRTSETVWIPRVDSAVVDNVIKRIANVVKIDESLLRMHKSAETLQLVKYEKDQYYHFHHDYGTDRPNSRFITFLMYLNTPMAGGSTDFREAECWGNKELLSFPATKGDAMFFYNLLPDGNADVSSLHSGTHVLEGEKFMTNLWIWDPYFS